MTWPATSRSGGSANSDGSDTQGPYYGSAHDLRAPLASLQGMVEAIDDGVMKDRPPSIGP